MLRGLKKLQAKISSIAPKKLILDGSTANGSSFRSQDLAHPEFRLVKVPSYVLSQKKNFHRAIKRIKALIDLKLKNGQ